MTSAFRLLAAFFLIIATGQTHAQITTAPILQVCMPISNGEKLSSNGCTCNTSDDCVGVCTGTINSKACAGGPDVPGCAVPGSGLGLSSNGCSCDTDADCRNQCSGGVPVARRCFGGGEPDGPPVVCRRPGLGGNNGIAGCPCDSSADCVDTCNAATRTCGGLVGAISNVEPAVAGQASASSIELGTSITDRALVTNAPSMPSSVTFRAYGPDDTSCTTIRVTSPKPLAGTGINGVVDSDPFEPPQAGQWRWRAFYEGNAWNLPRSTFCSDLSQRVQVTSAFIFGDGFE